MIVSNSKSRIKITARGPEPRWASANLLRTKAPGQVTREKSACAPKSAFSQQRQALLVAQHRRWTNQDSQTCALPQEKLRPARCTAWRAALPAADLAGESRTPLPHIEKFRSLFPPPSACAPSA